MSYVPLPLPVILPDKALAHRDTVNTALVKSEFLAIGHWLFYPRDLRRSIARGAGR